TSCLWRPPAGASAGGAPLPGLDAGLNAFERGAFGDAVTSWSEAARGYRRAGNPTGQLTALLHLSQAQSALGQYDQAVRSLEAALELADKSGDRARIAAVLGGLGNGHIPVRPAQQAHASLGAALNPGRQVKHPALPS